MKINCAIASKTTLLVGSLLALGMPAFGLPIFGILGFGGEKLFSFTLPSGPNVGSYIDFQNLEFLLWVPQKPASPGPATIQRTM